MNLTKNQTIAAGAIGAFVLVAGVLGYFLYDAIEVRGEQEEELEQQLSSFRRYNDAPVFPSAKTIAMVNTNKAALVAWRTNAYDYVARGDKKLASETPPIFKQRLAKTVRAMCALPGAGAGGHIVSDGFKFGFETYLGGGVEMPGVADVPRLAAQLDDIEYLVTNFVAAGVLEIRALRRIDPPASEEKSEKGRGNRGGRGSGRAAADAQERVHPKPTALEYEFSFTVRPEAFVNTLNMLTSDKRFFVVKNMAFKETADDITSHLSAFESEQSGTKSGRRGRRRAAGAAAPEEGETKVVSVVSDPEAGSPIQVDMTIAVWNFSTM